MLEVYGEAEVNLHYSESGEGESTIWVALETGYPLSEEGQYDYEVQSTLALSYPGQDQEWKYVTDMQLEFTFGTTWSVIEENED